MAAGTRIDQQRAPKIIYANDQLTIFGVGPRYGLLHDDRVAGWQQVCSKTAVAAGDHEGLVSDLGSFFFFLYGRCNMGSAP